MLKSYPIVPWWAGEPILLQQVCRPSSASHGIINIKLIEFCYSLPHCMQGLRSPQTVLWPALQTSDGRPPYWVWGQDVGYRLKVTCLVMWVWGSIGKVEKAQFHPDIIPAPQDFFGQCNWFRKRICKDPPVPYQGTGFGQDSMLKPYGHILCAAVLLSVSTLQFRPCWLWLAWSYGRCCKQIQDCRRIGVNHRCKTILTNIHRGMCSPSRVTNPAQLWVCPGVIVSIEPRELQTSCPIGLCAPHQSVTRSWASSYSSNTFASWLSWPSWPSWLGPSYSPSSECRLSSAGSRPCSLLSGTGSCISSQDKAGPSMAFPLLFTVNPAVTDSRLGGILVNLSLDWDLWARWRMSSLLLCLSCLDRRVLSTVSRSCCSVKVCSRIVIE